MLKKVMGGHLNPDKFYTRKQILKMNAGLSFAVIRFSFWAHRHEWKGFRNASNWFMKVLHAVKTLPVSLVISLYHTAALSAAVPADVLALLVRGTYKGGVCLVRGRGEVGTPSTEGSVVV